MDKTLLKKHYDIFKIEINKHDYNDFQQSKHNLQNTRKLLKNTKMARFTKMHKLCFQIYK